MEGFPISNNLALSSFDDKQKYLNNFGPIPSSFKKNTFIGVFVYFYVRQANHCLLQHLLVFVIVCAFTFVFPSVLTFVLCINDRSKRL